MAISRKNARQISVDQRSYTWAVSQDSGFIVLVVQDTLTNGKKLEVIVSDDRNIIIEKNSFSIQYGDARSLVVTPALVAFIIRESLKMGWAPQDTGPPVQLSLGENKLEIRRGL